MKRVTVLRHAKSSWDEPDLDDFDRPLNERGWKAARRMGEELKQRKLRFDIAFASPAVRVRQTLDGLTEGYGAFGFPVRFDQKLYLADAAVLFDGVRALPDGTNQALIVGHNPGLQRLILELAAEDRSGLRRRVADNFPTAALARIQLPAERWKDVASGSGNIVELIYAKDLD